MFKPKNLENKVKIKREIKTKKKEKT